MISVQIVDDHTLFAEGFSGIINKSNFAHVTGIYYSLKSCSEGLAKQLPDIMLLDIEMGDGDGIKFCAEITKTYPALKVIMVTGFREFNIAKHALHNGAHGYILKDSKAEEVYAGIKTVNNGEQFICEKINSIFKNEMTTHFIWLTNTEIQVLSLVAEGYTQRQVAKIICRDVETVKSHLKNIRIKLNAKNTAQAVKIAYELGILRKS